MRQNAMRQNASAQKIREKAAWIRQVCQPFSPEDARHEAEDIQHAINVRGIDAFNNPMFVDRVRWAMTMGFTIVFPDDNEFIRIFRV